LLSEVPIRQIASALVRKKAVNASCGTAASSTFTPVVRGLAHSAGEAGQHNHQRWIG
jgi:hypothetical protein